MWFVGIVALPQNLSLLPSMDQNDLPKKQRINWMFIGHNFLMFIQSLANISIMQNINLDNYVLMLGAN